MARKLLRGRTRLGRRRRPDTRRANEMRCTQPHRAQLKPPRRRVPRGTHRTRSTLTRHPRDPLINKRPSHSDHLLARTPPSPCSLIEPTPTPHPHPPESPHHSSYTFAPRRSIDRHHSAASSAATPPRVCWTATTPIPVVAAIAPTTTIASTNENAFAWRREVEKKEEYLDRVHSDYCY